MFLALNPWALTCDHPSKTGNRFSDIGPPHDRSSLVSSGSAPRLKAGQINYQNGNCFIPVKRLEQFPFPIKCREHRMTACHATERFADTGTHFCFVCRSELHTDVITWIKKSRIYFSANIPGQRKYHQSRINMVIHCSWKITKTYRTSPRSRYLSNINEMFIHEIFFPPTREENNKCLALCFFFFLLSSPATCLLWLAAISCGPGSV